MELCYRPDIRKFFQFRYYIGLDPQPERFKAVAFDYAGSFYQSFKLPRVAES